MSVEATRHTDAAVHSQSNDNGSEAASHKALSELKIHYTPQQTHAATETHSHVNAILTGFTLTGHDGHGTDGPGKSDSTPPADRIAPAPLTKADALFDQKFDEAFEAPFTGDKNAKYPKVTSERDEQYKAYMFNRLTTAIATLDQ